MRFLFSLLVLPLLLTHRVASLILTTDRSFESHSQFLALFPGITGNYLRNAFYRHSLQHCSPTATICFGALLSKTGAELHDHVYVGPRCNLGLVTLHNDVLLGPSVQIPSGPDTMGQQASTFRFARSPVPCVALRSVVTPGSAGEPSS